MASAYKHRPPYSGEAALKVVELLRGHPNRVLELGAGSGDFTSLLASHVEHITAIEPSDALRAIGVERLASISPSVQWTSVTAEEFTPVMGYGAVVAAESLHWMDWDRLFPLLGRCLPADGFLVLLDRDLAEPLPWDRDLRPLVSRYSTNQHFQECDLANDLHARGLYSPVGDWQTPTVAFRQPVSSYIESFHSRNGFSRDRLSPRAARTFDSELEALVSPHACDGQIVLATTTRLTWGHVTGRCYERPSSDR